jgi:bifunctional lysine-specific demethylase and histidyl-hydroxylase NO66
MLPADPFERIFAPIGMEQFGREYYERAVLHVARNDPQRFADIYGIADIEDALQIGARETNNFAVVKSGTPELPLEQYAPLRPSMRANYTGKSPATTIDARKVAEFFGQGWTLIVKDASLFSARMQRFCNALQAQTGWFVQPNVYLTPASAQGFDVHYDTHGTLIVQIEGEKTWRVYKPLIDLPLESQPFSAAAHKDRLALDREVLMRPGDTLYIPHGFAHEAASGGARTLHVTFAMLPLRVADLLEKMLAFGAIEDVELRRSLPPGWQHDPGFPARMLAELQPNIAAAFAEPRVAPAGERLLLEFYGATRIDASHAFGRVESAATIDGSVMLRLRTQVPYIVREGPDAVTLLIPGRSLALPSPCLPALRHLEAGPSAICDLPGLADVNQLWLARVLLTYGVAEVV